MEHLFNLHTLIEILLAISLSAASGFRVFVPLLTLSAAAVVGHIDLPTNLDGIEIISDRLLKISEISSNRRF